MYRIAMCHPLVNFHAYTFVPTPPLQLTPTTVVPHSTSYYVLSLPHPAKDLGPLKLVVSLLRMHNTHSRPKIKWGAMQRAKTLSVLALTVGTRAAEQAVTAAGGSANTSETNAAGGLLESQETRRPFFIQDPADGLCLSGSTFKRCAVDTLWRVEGEPGHLSVRHMAVREDGETAAVQSGA